MARTPLKAALLAGAFILSLPNTGLTAMAVYDQAAVGKATEQLGKMKDQLDKLNAMKKELEDQIKAIGKYGKITLPIVNTVKMGNQLKKDMQCLMPDWKELIPELKMDEQMFSICDRSQFYRDNLWVDPVKIGGKSVIDGSGDGSSAPKQIDWQAIEQARKRVKATRENIMYDATTKGLAQADQANETTEQTSKAIEDLQAMVDDAADQNARLAAIGQGQVVLATTQNQTNQLLAQLLKVMSAFVMEAGIPVERYGIEVKEEGQQ